MLGRDLALVLGERHSVIPVGRAQADITDAAGVLRALEAAAPDVVIHSAAFTAVDECERKPEIAFRVNGEGTGNVAAACKALRVSLMYVSTDYVFDGLKPDPYVENDPPNPINVYGKSKLEGERRVMELLDRFWIVRVSWLFGPTGKNFVRTILGLARGGGPLRVVDDQTGAPTYTADLAGKMQQIIERGKSGVAVGNRTGIYHVTNQGYCSWFEFAREAIRQAGLGDTPVLPIRTDESARPARRPTSSRLANAHLESEGLGMLPPWQDALARYLSRAEVLSQTDDQPASM